MNDDLTYLGFRYTYGGEAAFGLGAGDSRRHAYVIGQTGSGKTTLLRNLVLQHVARGDGLALIDPHGDLVEEVLENYPPGRADDLVYFNPADAAFPIGFNPLGGVAREHRALATAGLVSAFKGIWRDSWGPRLEYILAHAIAALIEVPNASLLGVGRMLADPGYRRWVVRQVRDPFVAAFWNEEFARYEPRFVREAVAPIQNKLGQLLLSPLLRHVLGQVGNALDLRWLMDHRRVLLVNLAKGRLGPEPAHLLGALLVGQILHAAMTRVDVPEEERVDFHLVIDEFQNFTTGAMAVALAEARKYRLNLVLAHQYLEQLTPETRAAVFGNIGTLLSFRVGPEDAADLAGAFGREFAAEHFSDLGQHEVLVRTLQDGVPCPAFRGRTLPPIAAPHARRHRLVRHVRERYATPREIVERRLQNWIASACYDD